MICFYKDNIGRIKFGSYEVPPTMTEYLTLDSIPNKSHGKLNSEQLLRYYSNEHNQDPLFVIEGIEPEPYIPTLQELKLNKIEELNNNYNTELSNGFAYTIGENTYIFNLDDNTENNIAKQKIDWDIQKTQEDYNENAIWFAITDSVRGQRIFNIENFLNFSALFGRKIKSLKITYASKRNLIETAETEEILNSVDIEFGD